MGPGCQEALFKHLVSGAVNFTIYPVFWILIMQRRNLDREGFIRLRSMFKSCDFRDVPDTAFLIEYMDIWKGIFHNIPKPWLGGK